MFCPYRPYTISFVNPVFAIIEVPFIYTYFFQISLTIWLLTEQTLVSVSSFVVSIHGMNAGFCVNPPYKWSATFHFRCYLSQHTLWFFPALKKRNFGTVIVLICCIHSWNERRLLCKSSVHMISNVPFQMLLISTHIVILSGIEKENILYSAGPILPLYNNLDFVKPVFTFLKLIIVFLTRGNDK